MDVIADEIDVLGSGVMGLTMKCARCHSHKFDPIPQRDYYRLKADLPRRVRRERLAQARSAARQRADQQRRTARPTAAIRDRPPSAASGRRRTRNASRRRNCPSRRFKHSGIAASRRRPTSIAAATRCFPAELVGPGVPSVLTDGKTPFDVQPPWPGAKKTGRRLAFAKWLTQPNNPLTARVMVNRIWKHHFGRGIVQTLGNFGKIGSPPSHPELLDWLATEFVRRGWSIKEMHRLMMTSSAYRQSSHGAQTEWKPTALFGRMPLTRLDAESLYDTMLLVAGRLDERRYGPGDPVQVRGDGLVTPNGTDRGWRRLIYVQQLRKQLPTQLETFDFPQMNPNCIERRDSTVAPQALYLMNNAMVDELAQRFAERVRHEAGDDARAQVERVYWIALSRAPSKEEQVLGVKAIQQLSDGMDEDWIRRRHGRRH